MYMEQLKIGTIVAITLDKQKRNAFAFQSLTHTHTHIQPIRMLKFNTKPEIETDYFSKSIDDNG